MNPSRHWTFDEFWAFEIGVEKTFGDVKALWMGVLGASVGGGFTLGPASGGLLGPYGYHVALLVAAAMAAANLVWAAVVLRDPETHAVESEPEDPQRRYSKVEA